MDVFEAITRRYSCRSFKPGPIESEKLSKILETGTFGPDLFKQAVNHDFSARGRGVKRYVRIQRKIPGISRVGKTQRAGKKDSQTDNEDMFHLDLAFAKKNM